MGLPTRSKCRHSLAFAPRAEVRWLIICLLGLAAGFAHAATPSTAQREYDVKAAALYNIIGFTEWPDSAFTSVEAPLVIAVFGRGPIGDAIAALIQKESWRGRRLVLQRNPKISESKPWHVVFVSRTEDARWPFLRGELAKRPILTVSDADDFAPQGGMVQMTIERGKLHLTVNNEAARAAQVQISSTVLRLAKVIDSSE